MVKKITNVQITGLYLNDYGRMLYLRESASLLGKPHQTIKPYVESLVKEGVLIKNERKNLTEYSLNFKNKAVYDHLIIAEKEKLMERLKVDTLLRVLFEKLSPFFGKNVFVIFGSAVDKIQKGSDIDLLVIGKQNISNELEDFENIYNKKIHKIQITNIENLTLALIKEIYKKHIIFNNTEQVVRFFGGLYEQSKLV
ncbi:MAG: hypothetical protein HYW24_05270 [Candidatus Aenigmarchaeota archaeon]|nr:hypothetical protein [Candidatus Aenigmarchaeota archaeon]